MLCHEFTEGTERARLLIWWAGYTAAGGLAQTNKLFRN